MIVQAGRRIAFRLVSTARRASDVRVRVCENTAAAAKGVAESGRRDVAALSSMSVDRVEDVRMAAEEAFIYACSVENGGKVNIAFVVDEQHVAMDFSLECDAFAEPEAENPAAYAGLILAAVCDVYKKSDTSAHLHLELKADI